MKFVEKGLMSMKKYGKLFMLFFVTLCLFFAFGVIGSAADKDSEPIRVEDIALKTLKEGVQVKWSACEEAEFYNIYRKTAKGKYQKIGETESGTRVFVDSSAVSGQSYTYMVTPCTNEQEGISVKEAATTFVAMPANVKIKNVTIGVKITWEKVKGAEKYYIYRKAPSDEKWTHITTVKNTDNYIDTNVKNTTDYLYTLRAKCGSFYSSYNSDGYKAYFLSATKISKIGNSQNGITVKWSSVKGAEKYYLYRKSSGTGWVRIAELPAKTLKYTDTKVTANKAYAYTLRVISEKAWSGYYGGTSIKYKYIPIVKVTSLENRDGGILVKWGKSSYATAYRLYRKAEGTTNWVRVATINGKNNVSYTDKKPSSGKSYAYTVVTLSGDYLSSYDSVGKTATFVGAPQNLTVKKTSAGHNCLTWTKVANATHYYVYRKTESASSWTLLGKIGNKNTATDTKGNKNTIYLYSVRAGINSKYYSDFSKSAKSSKVDPSKKMVALTYDDGPSNTVTNRILDVLQKYDARATFFVIGSRVDSNSAPLVRAYKMGCEIGNHTYTHINLPSYSNSSILNEVNKTNSVIKKYTGANPKIIRAPGGSTNERVRGCVNLPFIYWSVDTRDWEHRNASKTVSHIKNYVRDGSIILMHDIYAPTASASETIIPWLIKQGYQLVTVSELMEYRGINMKAGNSYTNGYKK